MDASRPQPKKIQKDIAHESAVVIIRVRFSTNGGGLKQI
jgi:hypothetical protein